MLLTERTVSSFLDELASKSPAPGGGSVAALSLALGAALARMVGELSMGKKRFLELAPSVQLGFLSAHEHMGQTLEKAKVWIDEDTRAFDFVMSAYQLPKTNETENAFRKQAIREATLVAIAVPRQVAQASIQALGDMAAIVPGANANTVSDQAVAVRMMTEAARGAIYNMLANKSALDDETMASALLEETKTLTATFESAGEALLERLENRLRK
jgi:formiminotetrahydrofolate cyclodeaminase